MFGSAQWCHDSAMRQIADKVKRAREQEWPQPCLACHDAPRGNLVCTNCVFSPGQITLSAHIGNLMNKVIWCRCSDTETHWADDGHQVFGNDTYICDDCGFVQQFG